MRRALIIVGVALLAACPSPEPAPDSALAVAPPSVDTVPAPRYLRTRAMDLTGDGVADTVRLVATGVRPDSLQVELSLVVDGRVLHEERWGSGYELALVDSAQRAPGRAEAALRARLDSVLARVRVDSIGAPGVRLMAEDRAILDTVAPRPVWRVSIAYGYETTARLAWDAPRRRFVRLFSCC